VLVGFGRLFFHKGHDEGSAAQKSKVFGGKKAKEKRENVTDCFEERKRK
jgi:hypothetical protein